MSEMKLKEPHVKPQGLIRCWVTPIGFGLLFLYLLRYVLFIGYVPSVSMEPAINKDSFIFGVRIIRTLNHGDIIIFKHLDLLVVKRVDALPGDRVQIGGDVLTVPKGHCYVLGDNRMDSIDSRYWDDPYVPLELIIAKLWPMR